MWFEIYCEPSTVDECVATLARFGPDATLLAGGTDVIPRFKSRNFKTKALVSLMSVEGLAGARREGKSLVVGAMTRLADLLALDGLTGPLQGIREGVGSVSSMQVRNVATLGGNSCNAAPSADTVPGLIAAGAEVGLRGPKGERRLPLEEFFLGPGKTALATGELLVDFRIPEQAGKTGTAYRKYAIRGNTDLAIVGVAARITLDGGQKVKDARLVLGAVAPTPLRARQAEKSLVGRVVDDAVLAEAAELAAGECNPISDQRASAGYRREMVRVWARHTVKEAALRAARS